MANKINAELLNLYRERLAEVREDEWWINFHLKDISEIVQLTDGTLFVIKKPQIQTSFCFPERGYDYDDAQRAADYARKSEEYFKAENLRGIQSWIDALEGLEDVWILPNGASVQITTWNRWDINDNSRRLGMEDRRRILEAYQRVKAGFEKRLNTYLKRYGLRCVRAWTYWMDR